MRNLKTVFSRHLVMCFLFVLASSISFSMLMAQTVGDTTLTKAGVGGTDFKVALMGSIGAIFPYVQGRLVVVFMDWIKKTYAWVANRSGWQKEVLVVLLNAAPIFISSLLGIPGLVGLDQWDYTVAATVLSSAISFSVKAGKKSKVLDQRITAIMRVQ